jgi:hypothetical protein
MPPTLSAATVWYAVVESGNVAQCQAMIEGEEVSIKRCKGGVKGELQDKKREDRAGELRR